MSESYLRPKPTGKRPAPPIPLRLAVRPKEAAQLLGISMRTLWTWTKNGHLPHLRMGNGKRRATLYRLAGLNAFLANWEQNPPPLNGLENGEGVLPSDPPPPGSQEN